MHLPDRSKELTEIVKTCLDKNGWQYRFDKDYSVFSFRLGAGISFDPITHYIYIMGNTIAISSEFPLSSDRQDKKTLSRLAEYICRANNKIATGKFTVDFNSGYINFEHENYFFDLLPSPVDIKEMIMYVSRMYRLFGMGLKRIIVSGADADKAFADCKSDLEEERDEVCRQVESVASPDEFEVMMARLHKHFGAGAPCDDDIPLAKALPEIRLNLFG